MAALALLGHLGQVEMEVGHFEHLREFLNKHILVNSIGMF